MHFTTIITTFICFALAAAQTTTDPVTGILGNASVVENNPLGLIYVATLPTSSFFAPDDPRGNIKGSVSASANPNGIGVAFQVNFANLPTSGGPFLYHIHVAPVPANGSCTATTGHLDPFIRGETPACDPTLPQTCQVGDLSGKHGMITSDPFTASYVDYFASSEEGIGAYFGNRSFVVHFANTTRFTCANFELLNNTGATTTTSTTSIYGGNLTSGSATTPTTAITGAATTTTKASPSQFTGGATTTMVGSAMGALGVVAVFALAF